MVTQAFSIRKVLEVVKVGLIVIAEVARAAVVKETELAMICLSRLCDNCTSSINYQNGVEIQSEFSN